MPRNQRRRVLIRPLKLSDCSAFVAAVHRSRRLHASWIVPKATTPRAFRFYLKRYKSERYHGFLVVHRESGGLVGIINVNDVIRGSFQSASLGYYAFLPYAGQGLMQEGMGLVLKYGFKRLKLHRLEANIQPTNRASIALVRKFGFVREGLSRRMLKVRGKWKDHERWALLSEDF